MNKLDVKQEVMHLKRRNNGFRIRNNKFKEEIMCKKFLNKKVGTRNNRLDQEIMGRNKNK